jgi:predicted RNA binding protein YcfA (HicA-like mRNA interferase family)
MRFLFIGSQFTLRASFPRSVALTQLRFTLLTVTSSQRDLHPQVCAHAGRTTDKEPEGSLNIKNNWDLTPIYTCQNLSLQNDITGAIIKTMNTATKLLNAMRQNPNDWAMAKLLTVAKQHGLEVRSTGGSHHVFSHPSAKDPLSVPAHRPIKAIYIKRFVALIDQILE